MNLMDNSPQKKGDMMLSQTTGSVSPILLKDDYDDLEIEDDFDEDDLLDSGFDDFDDDDFDDELDDLFDDFDDNGDFDDDVE